MPEAIKWENEIPKIKELGSMGLRMPAIAARYGVSRQRIKQIIDKFIPEWHTKYGGAVHKQERQDARYAKWGVKEDSELYAAKRQKFRAKKANACRDGTDWELTFGTLIWPTHCPILGLELDYFAEGRNENSVSFDKINSNLGYIDGNVQIVSWRANRIKNDGAAEEHRRIADYLDSLYNSVNLVCQGQDAV